MYEHTYTYTFPTMSNSTNTNTNTSSNDDDILHILDQIPSHTTTNFDPISFLNQNFQTEAKLVQKLPSLRTAVAQHLDHLDVSIRHTIYTTSNANTNTTSNANTNTNTNTQIASQLTNNVQNLKLKINAIQSRASASERAVQVITQQMKGLDVAKGHLQRTIVALKRLHMLTSAIERLKECIMANRRPS